MLFKPKPNGLVILLHPVDVGTRFLNSLLDFPSLRLLLWFFPILPSKNTSRRLCISRFRNHQEAKLESGEYQKRLLSYESVCNMHELEAIVGKNPFSPPLAAFFVCVYIGERDGGG